MADSSKGSDGSNISVITTRLVDIILAMSLEERKTLLKELEEKYFEGDRKYPRKDYLKEVDFVLNKRAFKGFIHDISAGGVLVESSESFTVGQMITLTFQLPDSDEHIKIFGKIARILPNIGFGVKFNKVIEEYSKESKKNEKNSD